MISTAIRYQVGGFVVVAIGVNIMELVWTPVTNDIAAFVLGMGAVTLGRLGGFLVWRYRSPWHRVIRRQICLSPGCELLAGHTGSCSAALMLNRCCGYQPDFVHRRRITCG